MFKRLLRRPAIQSLLGWSVAQYMHAVRRTTRWEVRHADRVAGVFPGEEGVIALTWHSRFLMLTSAWSKDFQLPYVMISRSRDGAVVAATCKALGLQTLRGSAKKLGSDKAKGGSRAALGAVEAIRAGGCVVITPDGPRGPRQRLGEGPVRLARASGAPLMPCTFAVQRRKIFDSWDRFVLPKLFGRGMIIWGTPVYVSKDADDGEIERVRLTIETEMNALLAEADTAMGHVPIAAAREQAS